MTISIHPVTTLKECRIIERLQAEIWGSDDIEVTPDNVLLTLTKEGSIVLLAMDEVQKPIGFAFGFLGLTADNRLKFASHIVGVLPAYQNQGIGYQLKLAQREAALARNLDLITWTFDPLQGRNARFNLRKLGAVCNTYLRHLYGDMRDGLNQGLPSDRFRIDWWIATDHVVDRITGRFVEQPLPPSECPILNSATTLDNGLLAPAETFFYPEAPSCLVEIPVDVNRLKSEAPDLALKWRWQTREIFEMAFATGYTAIDLLRRKGRSCEGRSCEGRNYYLLQKTRE